MTAALRAFVEALAARPDDHHVLTVATRESGHRDVPLVLGDLRAVLAELEAGEVHAEWGVHYPEDDRTDVETERFARRIIATKGPHRARLMRREVRTGPWIEAT